MGEEGNSQTYLVSQPEKEQVEAQKFTQPEKQQKEAQKFTQQEKEQVEALQFTQAQLQYLEKQNWKPKRIKGYSEEQLGYMCEDPEFLQLFSRYFSNETMKELRIYGTKMEESLWWLTYVRLFLANLKDLKDGIAQILPNLSPCQSLEVVSCQGALLGPLSMEQYGRQRGDSRYRGTYPCDVLVKSVNSVENKYVRFILQEARKKIEKLLGVLEKNQKLTQFQEVSSSHREITELVELKKQKQYVDQLLKRKEIQEIEGKNIGYHLKQLAVKRVKQGSQKNKTAYLLLFAWYDRFRWNQGFSGQEQAKQLITSFIYEEDEFANFLFTLWNLYHIMKEFKQVFEKGQKGEKENSYQWKENPLTPAMTDFLYQLEDNEGNQIELYFKVGKNLYWNGEETHVHLMEWAVPDISIRYKRKNSKKWNISQIKVINEELERESQFEKPCLEMEGVFHLAQSFLEENTDVEYKNQGIILCRNDTKAISHRYLLPREKLFVYSLGIPSHREEEEEMKEKGLISFPHVVQETLDIQKATGMLQDLWQSFALLRVQTGASEEEIDSSVEEMTQEILKHMEQSGSERVKKGKEKAELFLKDHVFSEIWDKLEERTRTFLIMGEYLYQELEFDREGDFSPAILMYGKALEHQMNVSLVKPFRAYVKENPLTKEEKEWLNNKYDETAKKWNNAILRKKQVGLTIVQIGISIKEASYSKQGEFLWNWRDWCKTNRRLSEELWNNGQKFNDIGSNYRNKAAHPDTIFYGRAEKARNAFLGLEENQKLFHFLVGNNGVEDSNHTEEGGSSYGM